MSEIGKFKKADGGYSGSISTLTLQLSPVRFVKRDKGANFSILGPDDCELGAGWIRSGEYGDYISVKLDCPALPAPINAILGLKANDRGVYALRWQRRENGRNEAAHSH